MQAVLQNFVGDKLKIGAPSRAGKQSLSAVKKQKEKEKNAGKGKWENPCAI